MWGAITWCSASSGPTTSTRRMSPSSRCCCRQAAKTASRSALKPGIQRHRAGTTDRGKLRQNKVATKKGGLKPGPPVYFASCISLSGLEQGGYPPKKNRGAELINARTVCVAGEARGPPARHGECFGDQQRRVTVSEPAIPGSEQGHGRAVVSRAAGDGATGQTCCRGRSDFRGHRTRERRSPGAFRCGRGENTGATRHSASGGLRPRAR